MSSSDPILNFKTVSTVLEILSKICELIELLGID